jgi:hypothetical protein
VGGDFDAKAARLQSDIEAVAECVQKDDAGCVMEKRDELKFASGDLRDEVTAIVAEKSGACQNSLGGVEAYLIDLDNAGQVTFAAAGIAEAPHPLVVRQAEQIKQDYLDVLRRVQQACS